MSTPNQPHLFADPPGDAGYDAATPTDLDSSTVPITTRAALPLGETPVAVWDQSSGTGLLAQQASLASAEGIKTIGA